MLFAVQGGGRAVAQGQIPCDCYNPDQNFDNAISITDLLGLLALFEQVDADNDGIWNVVDECHGLVDACGVCNGPGATVPVWGEVVYVTDSTFVESCGIWHTFTFPVDTLVTYVCPVPGCTNSNALNFNASANVDDGSCMFPPPQCAGVAAITFDGNTYPLVGIGNQCWFKENLRSDNYRNGDPIPGDLNNSQWLAVTSGAQAVYNQNAANLAKYGRLYNWYAVNDARGLCPAGFHVPTDGDWMVLADYLGGTGVAGSKMKASSSDPVVWDGTNSSGFSGLPGGMRSNVDGGGNFHAAGNAAWFFFVNETTGAISYRGLLTGADQLVPTVAVGYYNYFSPNTTGASIRCIKD